MKKIIPILILLMCVLCACSKAENIQPTLEQIRSICELSTLECYYNNVAKNTVKAGEGITHWGEKDRELWIEYDGYAKIGIELNKVDIKVNGDKVKIRMPKAKLLETGILNISKNSYYISEDGWFNKNKISAKDQQDAVSSAQVKMEKTVLSNEALFQQAEEKAKSLIERYVLELGEISEVAYKIEWEIYEEKEEEDGKK